MTSAPDDSAGPPVRLVVDGANVVGSRPDGWWRDRAGAAARLVSRLAPLAAAGDEVVVVLEGAARGGVAAGTVDGVGVVHAAGSGDDEIVVQAAVASASPVVVVTADRGLRQRLPAGVRAVGPSWLDGRLTARPGDSAPPGEEGN